MMRTIALVMSLGLGAAACRGQTTPVRPPAPAAASVRQALLAPAGDGVALLGCWDPTAHAVVDDARCLAGAPAGAELTGLDGSALVAGAPTDVTYCQIADEPDQTRPGFTLPAGRPSTELLVWPADAEVGLATLEAPASDQVRPAEAQQALALLARRSEAPLQAGAVEAIGSLDLDGDGRADRLLHAHAEIPRPDEPELPTQVAGIYADLDDGRGVIELASETGTPSGSVGVVAVLDLGGDGKRELVIEAQWNGGYWTRLYTFGPGAGGALGCDS